MNGGAPLRLPLLAADKKGRITAGDGEKKLQVKSRRATLSAQPLNRMPQAPTRAVASASVRPYKADTTPAAPLCRVGASFSQSPYPTPHVPHSNVRCLPYPVLTPSSPSSLFSTTSNASTWTIRQPPRASKSDFPASSPSFAFATFHPADDSSTHFSNHNAALCSLTQRINRRLSTVLPLLERRDAASALQNLGPGDVQVPNTGCKPEIEAEANRRTEKEKSSFAADLAYLDTALHGLQSRRNSAFVADPYDINELLKDWKAQFPASGGAAGSPDEPAAGKKREPKKSACEFTYSRKLSHVFAEPGLGARTARLAQRRKQVLRANEGGGDELNETSHRSMVQESQAHQGSRRGFGGDFVQDDGSLSAENTAIAAVVAAGVLGTLCVEKAAETHRKILEAEKAQVAILIRALRAKLLARTAAAAAGVVLAALCGKGVDFIHHSPHLRPQTPPTDSWFLERTDLTTPVIPPHPSLLAPSNASDTAVLPVCLVARGPLTTDVPVDQFRAQARSPTFTTEGSVGLRRCCKRGGSSRSDAANEAPTAPTAAQRLSRGHRQGRHVAGNRRRSMQSRRASFSDAERAQMYEQAVQEMDIVTLKLYIASLDGQFRPEHYSALLRLSMEDSVVKPGASQQELATLQSRKATSADELGECVICMEKYEPEEGIASFPQCSHEFHLACAVEYLKSYNKRCPLCKRSLSEPSSPAS
ncbi:hypothetical protein DIPPA_03226 [Diplonema papillatum]|nr:hypothetical protein DIPPA_03226 [Diplonema papillatum]